MAYDPRDTSNTETTTIISPNGPLSPSTKETTKTVGIVAVVAVVVLALAGYFFYNRQHTGVPMFSTPATSSSMSNGVTTPSTANGGPTDSIDQTPKK